MLPTVSPAGPAPTMTTGTRSVGEVIRALCRSRTAGHRSREPPCPVRDAGRGRVAAADHQAQPGAVADPLQHLAGRGQQTAGGRLGPHLGVLGEVQRAPHRLARRGPPAPPRPAPRHGRRSAARRRAR